MYHIIRDLELMFDSIEAAQAWAASMPVFKPSIPANTMENEDRATPRICGAPKIENCITGLGVLGAFRRCLNANKDAKSYENDNEAYPIFVVEFSDDGWIKPSKSKVPDAATTHEHWCLHDIVPLSIELRWLDAYSIKTREGKLITLCRQVKFLDDLTGYHHPWLDGKGHPLDCSDCGGDPWPVPIAHTAQIYYDKHRGGRIGFAMPSWPFDGRWLFQPFNPCTAPYKTFQHNLQAFTGFYDVANLPIFQGFDVTYTDTNGNTFTGIIEPAQNGGWQIKTRPPYHFIHLPAPCPDNQPVLKIRWGFPSCIKPNIPKELIQNPDCETN